MLWDLDVPGLKNKSQKKDGPIDTIVNETGRRGSHCNSTGVGKDLRCDRHAHNVLRAEDVYGCVEVDCIDPSIAQRLVLDVHDPGSRGSVVIHAQHVLLFGTKPLLFFVAHVVTATVGPVPKSLKDQQRRLCPLTIDAPHQLPFAHSIVCGFRTEASVFL